MNWSYYNTIIKRKGKNLLYNSLTNSFAEFTDKQFDVLLKIKNNEINTDNIDFNFLSQLKEAKILVESDEDERLKIDYLTNYNRFDRSRLELTIFPTLDCNFRCSYCYETLQKIKMSDETLDDIITFIKKHKYIEEIYVTWMGGEPLLEFDSIKRLSMKILDIGIPYDASLITNGFLFNEDIIKYLPSLKISNVQITIDGLENIHDSRRMLSNGKGSFKTIVKNIHSIFNINNKLPIHIRVNIDKNNEDEFILLHQFLKSEFEDYPIYIVPAFVDDITNKNNKCNLDRLKQINFLTKLYSKYNFKDFSFYPQNYNGECGIRNINSYNIGPSGEIYKCWNHVGNKDDVIGYINQENWINPMKWITYIVGCDPMKDNECLKCKIYPICNGGCPDKRIKNNKKDFCSKFKGEGLHKLLNVYYDIKKE